MTRFFHDLVVEMEQALQSRTRDERSTQMATSYTPRQMENFTRHLLRNPQLPADVQLALMDVDDDNLFDEIGLEVANLRSSQSLWEQAATTTLEYMGDPGPGLIGSITGPIGSAVELGLKATPASILNAGPVKKAAQVAFGAAEVGPQLIQGDIRRALAANDPNIRGGESLGPRTGEGDSWLENQIDKAPYVGNLYNAAFNRDEMAADLKQRFERPVGSEGAGELNPREFLEVAMRNDPMLQTDLGQMMTEFAANATEGKYGLDKSDWGSGFFISRQSELIKRRAQQESRAARFEDGRTVTAGRYFAGNVLPLEQDSKAYTVASGAVDAFIALAPSLDTIADPAIHRLVQGSATAAGRVNPGLMSAHKEKFMQDIGAYNKGAFPVATRDTSLFINSPDFAPIIDDIVNSTGADGFAHIWRRTGQQYHPNLAIRLTDADNADDVKRILIEGMGHGEVPDFRSGLATRISEKSASVRLFGDVPGETLTLKGADGKWTKRSNLLFLDDGKHAVNTIDEFANNIKAPMEMRNRWIEQMARADNISGRRETYHDVLADTMDYLEPSLGQQRSKELAQYAKDLEATDRLLFEEMNGMTVSQWGDGRIAIAGESDQLPGAYMLSQRATALSLPDPRELKRATGAWRALYEVAENADSWGRISTVLQHRVPGTGFTRVDDTFFSASGAKRKTTKLGYDKTTKLTAGQVVGVPLNTVLDTLEWFQRIWKSSRLARIAYPVRVVGEEQLRMAAAGYDSMFNHPISFISDIINHKTYDDLLGELMEDSVAFKAARTGSDMGGMRDSIARFRSQDLTLIGRNDKRFFEAWQDTLLTTANDRVMQEIARSKTIDEVMDWFGIERLDGSLPVHSRPGEGSEQLRQLREMADGALDVDSAVREYIRSNMRRISAITGDSEDLLMLMRRGGDNVGVDLTEMTDVAPAQLAWVPSPERGGAVRNRFDQATTLMFQALGSAPTNALSRSPVFRQQYVRNVHELAPLVDDAAELITAARATGLFSKDDLARLAREATGGGALDIKTIDSISKAGALDTVESLLYDVTKKSQFFDTYRLLFPFGEAWKEVMTTWLRLVKENPARISRRVMQAAEGGRDAGVFGPDSNGDLAFFYPGSEQLMEATTGAPIKLSGRLSGLNLIGEMFPTLGPVGQYPAAKFLPNTTDYDHWRGILLPYGDPGDWRDITTNFFPTWARTIINRDGGLTQAEIDKYGNTEFRVRNFMASTGEYDRTSRLDMRRLDEDAQKATPWVFFMRGAVQMFAPSSPQLVHQVIGEDGELAEQHLLLDRLYKLRDEDPENALENFIKEVGINNIGLTGKNTTATVHGGIPIRGEGFGWIRDNQELADDHPNLIGFFAPQDPDGDFNYDAYLAAKDRGELEPLDLDEKWKLANHNYATMLYYRKRDLITAQNKAAGRSTLTDEQREYMRGYKEYLLDEFPGYTETTFQPKDKVWQVIDQGQVAGKDGILDDEGAIREPDLAGNGAALGLQQYWLQRRKVLQSAEGMGLALTGQGGWRQVQDAEHLREWLRQMGNQIAVDYPEFAMMWERFLRYEFKDDAQDD